MMILFRENSAVKTILLTIETTIIITTHNLWLKAKVFNLKLVWEKISRDLSSTWVHPKLL
jgi:hypothetical protein